ncbi:MAG: hypothetical protein QM811_00005, partial [Pirellulales bacterium]
MSRPLWGLLTLCVLGIGCGKAELYPVHGRVVFADGKPLKAGSVEFLHKTAEGKSINARAGLDEKGEFTLKTSNRDGAVPGEHQVIVMPYRPDESDSTKKVPPDPIDSVYMNYATTPLKAVIEAK